MTLTIEEIKDIALLARIGINDDEAVQYQKDLSSILEYFNKLQEVNTDDIEEIGHITGVENVYRRDVVDESSDEEKQAMMTNVPDAVDGHIKVKSVL